MNRINNFDLIRLVAATQVVLWHGIEHLNIAVPPLFLRMLGSFPGVPIFFVVSGYLVTASYRRSSGLGRYFENRALRIFPGLWVCFLLTFLSVALVQGVREAGVRELAKWIIPNIVGIAQTPTFLHEFGTGSVNGSLWTIPVELQFYLTLPFLTAFLARSGSRWIATFLLFIGFSFAYMRFGRSADSGLIASLALRALPSWLYMFMLGMILELRRDWVEKFMVGRFGRWLGAYTVWLVLLQSVGVNTVGNTASPLVLIPLAGVILSAAYSCRDASARLLRHNDISYGVYLYHIPIMNILIAVRPDMKNWMGLVFCTALTSLVSALSWVYVERPALRRKPLC